MNIHHVKYCTCRNQLCKKFMQGEFFVFISAQVLSKGGGAYSLTAANHQGAI